MGNNQILLPNILHCTLSMEMTFLEETGLQGEAAIAKAQYEDGDLPALCEQEFLNAQVTSAFNFPNFS